MAPAQARLQRSPAAPLPPLPAASQPWLPAHIKPDKPWAGCHGACGTGRTLLGLGSDLPRDSERVAAALLALSSDGCASSPWAARRPPGLRVQLGTPVCVVSACVRTYVFIFVYVCVYVRIYTCVYVSVHVPVEPLPTPPPLTPPRIPRERTRGPEPRPAPRARQAGAPRPRPRAALFQHGGARLARAGAQARPPLPSSAAASAQGRKARPGSSLWLPAEGSAPPPLSRASPPPALHAGTRPVLPRCLAAARPPARPEPAPRRHPRCPKMEARGSP